MSIAPSPMNPPQKAPRPHLADVPDAQGRFGAYGGAYVPETLIAALEELASVYQRVQRDGRFWDELREYQRTFVGRPTPLNFAANLTAYARSKGRGDQGARIWLKREDLA